MDNKVHQWSVSWLHPNVNEARDIQSSQFASLNSLAILCGGLLFEYTFISEVPQRRMLICQEKAVSAWQSPEGASKQHAYLTHAGGF